MKRTHKIQKADEELKRHIAKAPSHKKALIKEHLHRYKKLEQKEHHTKRPTIEMEEREITAMPLHHHSALAKHHSKLADHHSKMAGHHKTIAQHHATHAKHHSPKESPKAKHFIEKRMHDFKEGEMHSRKHKTGPLVTNPKQAIAIALSESRKKGMKVSRKK